MLESNPRNWKRRSVLFSNNYLMFRSCKEKFYIRFAFFMVFLLLFMFNITYFIHQTCLFVDMDDMDDNGIMGGNVTTAAAHMDRCFSALYTQSLEYDDFADSNLQTWCSAYGSGSSFYITSEDSDWRVTVARGGGLSIVLYFFAIGHTVEEYQEYEQFGDFERYFHYNAMDFIVYFVTAASMTIRMAISLAGLRPTFEFMFTRMPRSNVDYAILTTHFFMCVTFTAMCWKALRMVVVEKHFGKYLGIMMQVSGEAPSEARKAGVGGGGRMKRKQLLVWKAGPCLL